MESGTGNSKNRSTQIDKNETASLSRPGRKTRPTNNPIDSYHIIGAKSSLYGSDEAFQNPKKIGSRIISREVYLKETSSAQRAALTLALNKTISHFIENQRAVFLEGLGIIFPVISKSEQTYNVGSYSALRTESKLSVEFEKCDDSSALDVDKYKNIANTSELAHHCLLHLCPNQCISWAERDVRRFLRGLLKNLRNEIVTTGYANDLDQIGVFFALHNRQGDSLNDWFAGADIGLKPIFEQRLSVSPPSFFEKPILRDAFELLEAAFGPSLLKFEIDLHSELKALGYDVSELQENESTENLKIPVSVFERKSEKNKNERILIYCTDGLRKIALAQKEQNTSVGTEAVFQLAVSANHQDLEESPQIPTWVARPLAMAWILLQSSARKILNPGAGLSCDLPLRPRFDTELDTIFLTQFKATPTESLSPEGPFRYVNVLGITKDEAAIAADISQDYLLTLLRYKGLDQITRATRTSITQKLALPESRKRAVSVHQAGA